MLTKWLTKHLIKNSDQVQDETDIFMWRAWSE